MDVAIFAFGGTARLVQILEKIDSRSLTEGELSSQISNQREENVPFFHR